ncbi:DASH complex subunit Ask1 domain-containing protein [Trichoderma novae-zelandiae]
MSRQSVAPRNLSLTEELEKLEQSITLTLQEIDHNFSKAHRIVTTGILPRVEQYGEHSRAVWEASKFWKQFFESSANVSLSGYEDQANGNGEETSAVEDSSAMRDEMTIDVTADLQEEATRVSAAGHRSALHGDESMLDDAELAGSTPRPPASRTKADVLKMESPYEAMRREMDYEEGGTMASHQDSDEEMDSSVLFAQHTARLPDISTTPGGLPNFQRGDESVQRKKDPLLHRVLDKTYRIQATPHKSSVRLSPVKGKQPALPQQQQQRDVAMAWHDSPMSSPEIAIPTLRSEAFMTPFKSNVRQRLAAASQAPRTPGVSVQTPAAAKKTRDVFAAEGAAASGGKPAYEIDWESDEDDNLGMSPPKTIQFALPPSKLLQTPAREASKRIVDDILLEAGAGVDSSEYSPSMVKMNEDILNDSF